MTIYYSHPKSLYDTIEERNNINLIHKIYPNSIVMNPKDIKVSDEDKPKLSGEYVGFLEMMAKYYYPEIKKCDVFVYDDLVPMTGGVELEIKYALCKSVKIRTLQELKEELEGF